MCPFFFFIVFLSMTNYLCPFYYSQSDIPSLFLFLRRPLFQTRVMCTLCLRVSAKVLYSIFNLHEQSALAPYLDACIDLRTLPCLNCVTFATYYCRMWSGLSLMPCRHLYIRIYSMVYLEWMRVYIGFCYCLSVAQEKKELSYLSRT